MMRVASRVLVLLGCALLLMPTAQADEHGLDTEARMDIEVAWLEGNLERMAEYHPRIASAEDLLCLAIRDLYWRPDPGAAGALRSRYAALAQPDGDSLLAKRWQWLLNEKRTTPWPLATESELDPWPALSLLVQDRERRELQGNAGYPGQDPISVYVTKHTADGSVSRDLRLIWLTRAGDQFGRVYGDLPETPEEMDDRTKASALRSRNEWIGFLGVLALVILSLGYARRIKLDV